MRFSSLPSDRWVSRRPVRRSNCLKPSTASRPLVVPDRVSTVSHILIAVSMAGRPAPAPCPITPCLAASCATSTSGCTVTPLVVSPRVSTKGPRVSHCSAPAGYRDLARCSPIVFGPARVGGLAGSVVLHRHHHHVPAHPQVGLGQPAEHPGDGVERVEIGPRFPGRVDGRAE